MAELKTFVKTGALKVPEAPTRTTPVCHDRSAVTGVCQTTSSHPHHVTTERKGGEGRNKNELFELQWSYLNKNDCYIFHPYLRVWVFLFLQTSFFTAQNVGPMVHWHSITERSLMSYPRHLVIQIKAIWQRKNYNIACFCFTWVSPRWLMVNVLNCNHEVNEFELQLRYDVLFQTNTLERGMNPLFPSAMDQIAPLLYFYKNRFGIE